MGNRKSSSTYHIDLGDEVLEVVPQKLGYLKHRLGDALGDLAERSFDGADDVLSILGDQAYEVLGVFIPQLHDQLPKWKWDGYASPTAAEQGQYDVDGDNSPDADQLVTAFQIVMKANKIDLFKHLGKLVDPTVGRAFLTERLMNSMTGNSSPIASTPGSDSESSTTTDPTIPGEAVEISD